MIKIFFITFFIAELIIATAIILRIHKLNKFVNKLNDLIPSIQMKMINGFNDFRLIIEEFNRNFIELRKLLEQKKQEYSWKFLKTSLIYGSLFFLKGNYRRLVLGYQLIKEIYEEISEN